MSDEDIDNENLEQPEKSQAAHFVWQYFAVTNNIDARKGGAKNAVCMTKASVDAAPPEQQHISQDVVSWPKKKLEYVHVLLFTKMTMTDVVHSELPRILSAK